MQTTGIRIGTVNCKSKLILAPMAGLSNMAFRLSAKEYGAGLVCTEMMSADGLVHGNERTQDLVITSPEERPISMQLFGNDGDIMARAAQMIESKADIIDLNFGCPAKKVVRSRSGSSLLRTPEVLEDIVKKVVNSVSCPVTAKIRAGWDEKTKNAVEIAHIVEESGAAAVIVHPRTRSQGFSGSSDWNIIAEVKNSISIPVIGNGDINTPEEAKAMLELTGCDGIMIGRGAMGNPWIFSRTIHYLETGIILPPPTSEDRLAHLLKFASDLVNLKGEYIASREIRKFVKWYTRGMPQAKEFRELAVRVESYEELENFVKSYIASLQNETLLHKGENHEAV